MRSMKAASELMGGLAFSTFAGRFTLHIKKSGMKRTLAREKVKSFLADHT
jgi:hypothetical protein